MKLKITKTFDLANPEVWLPHWRFTKDQVLETDNEYLIDRLLILKTAKILDKKNVKKQPVAENKMQETPKNKTIKIKKRKGTPDLTVTSENGQ